MQIYLVISYISFISRWMSSPPTDFFEVYDLALSNELRSLSTEQTNFKTQLL